MTISDMLSPESVAGDVINALLNAGVECEWFSDTQLRLNYWDTNEAGEPVRATFILIVENE